MRLLVWLQFHSEVKIIAKRILITEDDASFLKAISHILEKEGYQVDTASNGIEGLNKARNGSPDLLILDVMLPGLDGFEVCSRLRAESRTAELPILMLSAKGQEADLSAGQKVGADEYLTKPVDRPELLFKIKDMLAR